MNRHSTYSNKSRPESGSENRRDAKPRGAFSRNGGRSGADPSAAGKKVRRSPDRAVPLEENERTGTPDEQPFILMGRNAVREALRSGKSINRILVLKDRDGSLGELISLAKDQRIEVRETDRKKLDELCMPFGHGDKPGNHQGIVAYVAGVVVLDGIEDPHNLGSILRSAECAGAHGVVIGKRRSVAVTPAAVKASAGAAEYMHIARVTNISAAITELKKAGLWVAGADMSGTDMTRQGLNGPLALVIGSEGSGLSKLVRDTCDFLVSIPLFGKIDSLNAGVAAGILMFEKKRQDRQGT